MIFTPGNVNEISKRFLDDRPLVLISGVLAMSAGLAIVNSYNVWKVDWSLIITLFGWALTLGGASRIIMPDLVGNIGRSMTASFRATIISGIVWLILGIFLTIKGYT